MGACNSSSLGICLIEGQVASDDGVAVVEQVVVGVVVAHGARCERSTIAIANKSAKEDASDAWDFGGTEGREPEAGSVAQGSVSADHGGEGHLGTKSVTSLATSGLHHALAPHTRSLLGGHRLGSFRVERDIALLHCGSN